MAGHRIFAALYDRMLAGTERAGLADLRGDLIGEASGRTLELGAGTGANAVHYSDSVSELVLSEPDPHMARRMREKLAASPPTPPYSVVEAGAQELPFEDDSFDTVVSTLVLCTVPEPHRALSEAARVLRGGGRLLLIEHVRDPEEGGLARWQDRLERPWGWFAAGCHPNRDARASLAAAGFETDGLVPFRLPSVPPLVRPGVRGEATLTAG
jgi:ubiquinone/menaquinone biosynthesis C-methylase UbiE